MVYKSIMEKALSVRQVEELVRQMTTAQKASASSIGVIKIPIHFRKIQEDLQSHFGTQVQLKRNHKGKGELVIAFASDNELNRILGILQQ